MVSDWAMSPLTIRATATVGASVGADAAFVREHAAPARAAAAATAAAENTGPFMEAPQDGHQSNQHEVGAGTRRTRTYSAGEGGPRSGSEEARTTCGVERTSGAI